MTEWNHEYVVPNNSIVMSYEADLLTFTRAGLVHEFECKLNLYDYRADFKKLSKHQDFENRYERRCPNYFWYATLAGFEIDPPEYAGWLVLLKCPERPWEVDIRKMAPKLHKAHLNENRMRAAYRCMAHHVRQEFWADVKPSNK
jgi:hypothetical protein